MGQVSAASTILIDVEPAATLAAVADYQKVRPKILSPQYSEYQVLQGGQGPGTVAKWKLQATKSRVRDVQVNVDVAGHTVIEKDANSSMVTNWTVAPAGPGSSVTVKTSWRSLVCPGATGNRHCRAHPLGGEFDGNRRVGEIGERAQRRRAVGA